MEPYVKVEMDLSEVYVLGSSQGTSYTCVAQAGRHMNYPTRGGDQTNDESVLHWKYGFL